MRYPDIGDTDCAIAQALGVVGDWWTLLVSAIWRVVGTASPTCRPSSGISREVLPNAWPHWSTTACSSAAGIPTRPPRYEYHLTARPRLLPGAHRPTGLGRTRSVLGDGSLTATGAPGSTETETRMHALVGRRPYPSSS